MSRFLSTLSLRRATVTFLFYNNQCQDFYPRSPCGERHCFRVPYRLKVTISIHALLAESDSIKPILSKINTNFYPRSPCGERLVYALILANAMLFLSTLSLRRATTVSTPDKPKERFLSTLSLRRATLIEFRKLLYPGNFYPRSPCGERRYLGAW